MPKHQLLLDSSSLSLAARLVAIVASHTPSNLTLGNAPVLALGSDAAAKGFDVLTSLASLAPTKAGSTSGALQLGGATDAERKQVAEWAAILAAESTPLSGAFLERLNAHLLTASFLPVSAFRPTTVDYAVWAAISASGAAIDAAKLPNLARWERAVVASVPRIGAAAEMFLKGTSLAVEHAAAVSGAAAAAADAAIEASLPHSAIFDVDVVATAAAELKGRVTAAAAAPAAASSSSAAAAPAAAAKKGEDKKAAAAAAPKAAAAAGGAAAPAKEKAAKPAKEAKAAAAAPAEVSQVYRVDFRVGRITSVTAHPTEARLYVEQIDVGAESGGVRTVVSGLAEFFKPEELLNRLVVVMVNVKSGDMKGVESAGRVMVATSADGKTKELASPPEGAKVGEQVTFADVPASSKPDQPIAPKRLHEIMSITIHIHTDSHAGAQRYGIFDRWIVRLSHFACLLCCVSVWLCPAVFRKHLHTNAQKVVQYANTDFQTSAGPVTVPTIADGTVA